MAKEPDHIHLEERIAHLLRAFDDLSDVVTRQEREIGRLNRQIAMLVERELARSDTDEAAADPNTRPPHW